MCSNKCHWADHWKGLKVAISTINSTYRHLSLSSVRCWVRRVKSERDPRTFWTVVGTLIAWKIYTQWYHASQKLRLSAPSKKKKNFEENACLSCPSGKDTSKTYSGHMRIMAYEMAGAGGLQPLIRQTISFFSDILFRRNLHENFGQTAHIAHWNSPINLWMGTQQDCGTM